MQKHLFGLLFLAGWAFLAPASSVSLLQAQSITPITIPLSGTYTASETLSKDSYRGDAAASQIGHPTRGGGGWNNHEQDWFSVYLVAGLKYTFTEAMSGDPNDNAFLSLQNSSGVQVAFERSTQPTGTMGYRPTASGTYTLICSRNDDVLFTSPFTLTVSVQITTTTTTIDAPPVSYPDNAFVSVTVSDATATPIGSVTLSVNGGPGMTQTLTGGSTTFTLTGLSVGSYSLSASYSGYPGFTTSSASGTLTVYPIPTTTTVTAASVTYPFNTSVLVTVTDSSLTPLGSVTLSVDDGAGITQTLSNGSTTFTPLLSAGIHTLSATYNPQPGFAPSSSASFVSVNPPTNLTVPVSQAGMLSTSSYQGTAASTALSGGQSGWPAGFFQDWYTVTLTAGSTYTISIETTGDSFLSIQNSSGTQVAYNDDAGLSSLGGPLASQVVFTPSTTDSYTIICSTGPTGPTTPLSYTLTIPQPVVNVGTATAINAPTGFPESASVTVTVMAASGTPTGNVTLSVDGGPGITQLLTNGSTTFTLTGLSGGNHSLSASYPGAPGFLPSSSTGTLFIDPPLGIPNVRLAPPAGMESNGPTRLALRFELADRTFETEPEA